LAKLRVKERRARRWTEKIGEQMMIDRMGGIGNLLNKVNPIGPNRFGLMHNQPYTR
jgi:hypothetical protein